jgi:hypothetical protein
VGVRLMRTALSSGTMGIKIRASRAARASRAYGRSVGDADAGSSSEVGVASRYPDPRDYLTMGFLAQAKRSSIVQSLHRHDMDRA